MSGRIERWGRLTVVGVMILSSLVPIAGHAAADPVGVELACPATIASTGGPLNISLTLSNKKSSSQSIAKSALLAYLGNLNVLGPFSVPFVRTLPPFGTQVVPYMASSFPAGVAVPGTFVILAVTVMDSANKPLGSNICYVQIQ